MKLNIARREFLKRATQSAAVIAVGPLLWRTFVGQLLKKAVAAGAPPPVSYLYMTGGGGMPAWNCMLPLTPNGSKDLFDPGANQFGTIIDPNNTTQMQYTTEKISSNGQGYYMAPIWNRGNGNVAYNSLLSNMTLFRGVMPFANSHPIASASNVAPDIGALSLSGLAADASNLPIPALIDPNLNAATVFSAQSGVSPLSVDYNTKANPVLEILSPFTDFRQNYPDLFTAQMNVLIEQTQGAVERYAEANGLSKTALPGMYENAISLMEQAVVNIASKWDATYQKYSTIVNTAINRSIPGVTDIAVVPNGKTDPAFQAGQGIFMDPGSNLTQLRSDSTNFNLPQMAANFAIAELMLGYTCSSMTLGCPGFDGVNLGLREEYSVDHDQHFVGMHVANYLNTLYWEALLSCLIEFRSVTQGDGRFNNTVMHWASEWSRTPAVDKHGSDHGYIGGGYSLLMSGMIPQFSLIGNLTTANKYGSNYPGSFGTGSTYQSIGRFIQTNDIALTVAQMIGSTEPIVTNGYALLQYSGGSWVPRFSESPTNVAT